MNTTAVKVVIDTNIIIAIISKKSPYLKHRKILKLIFSIFQVYKKLKIQFRRPFNLPTRKPHPSLTTKKSK